MEKLTFYSLSSPDKLDRIGEYLYQKATKDINRKRYKLAEIAMEAMALLLQACHTQPVRRVVPAHGAEAAGGLESEFKNHGHQLVCQVR
ncbi:protein EFR3 homolog cmp44E-like [Drosophila miranda]|uniref:protein EFR3 homolog cmp44E-like n=1 Tax=Drosophila miranda TaxID=7229 RepID=UPI00143F9946|nr:protein EFR3 homolog cmp44E-like [Drosophila miranda]